MKIRTLIATGLLLPLLAGLAARAAEPMTRFGMKPGSKMRIEGTANMIHTHWQVESPIIAGSLEAGPNFPTEPGQTVAPGKVDAHADPFIPVRSLKSVEDNGTPYSDAMDEVMYQHLHADTNMSARIMFHLTDLTLKDPAKAKDDPYVFEAKGDLALAGVTNAITMPVNVLPLGNKALKITGSTSVKMTDFKIEPPAPKIALGALKTGDDVKLIFTWMVAPRTTPAPAK